MHSHAQLLGQLDQFQEQVHTIEQPFDCPATIDSGLRTLSLSSVLERREQSHPTLQAPLSHISSFLLFLHRNSESSLSRYW